MPPSPSTGTVTGAFGDTLGSACHHIRSLRSRRHCFIRRTAHFGYGLRGYIIRVLARSLSFLDLRACVTHIHVEPRAVAAEHKIQSDGDTRD